MKKKHIFLINFVCYFPEMHLHITILNESQDKVFTFWSIVILKYISILLSLVIGYRAFIFRQILSICFLIWKQCEALITKIEFVNNKHTFQPLGCRWKEVFLHHQSLHTQRTPFHSRSLQTQQFRLHVLWEQVLFTNKFWVKTSKNANNMRNINFNIVW